MINTADEVKAYLTKSFSCFFGTEPSFDLKVFQNVNSPLVELAKLTSDFTLSKQATKYQNLLVGLSSSMILVSVLDLTKIDFVVQDLTIDAALRWILSIALVTLTVALLVRFVIDAWLHRLELGKYSQILAIVANETNRSVARTLIGIFYWDYVFDCISSVSAFHHEVQSGNESAVIGFGSEAPRYDGPVPEGVERDLEYQQAIASNVLCHLKNDCEEYSKRVAENPESTSVYMHAQTCYELTLSKWLEGRNQLVYEDLNRKLDVIDKDPPYIIGLKRITTRLTLSRMANLVIVAFEVVGPIALGIVALWLISR